MNQRLELTEKRGHVIGRAVKADDAKRAIEVKKQSLWRWNGRRKSAAIKEPPSSFIRKTAA
ncbi:hypothetical protein ABD67_00930 [Bacillus sonorensis]|uniref:hypothetical protein n=1 Tax=Bacillus sonorensis TaxID=119858 RepID=UPI0018CD7B80|nr:hypothetical protein [Bacillus sonorensis]MBG9913507.1 hypothetical protein [Bacillus sonorensis]